MHMELYRVRMRRKGKGYWAWLGPKTTYCITRPDTYIHPAMIMLQVAVLFVAFIYLPGCYSKPDWLIEKVQDDVSKL